MSSGQNSMYINFQTRPKINKHRVENVAKKGWNISSAYFRDGILKSQESHFKPSLNQKSSNDLAQSKERNTEHLSKFFLSRIGHSIKRKSVSEMPGITNDFSEGDEESAVWPISSFNDNAIPHKRLKNDFPRRSDVVSSLQIKKTSLQQVPQQHIEDTLFAFQNVFEMKLKMHANIKENELLPDNFRLKSFVSDNNFKKVPIIVPSKYSSLAETDILICDQENDKTLSKLILKQDLESNGYPYNNINFNGSVRAPFKISNHKIVSCEDTSSYGTNWVQSLNWSSEEDSHHYEKKRIPKITTGGYAARVLKLQRKELSEKNIYEHKMGANKIIGSLRMCISSVFYLDELILTKCFMISEEEKKLKSHSLITEKNLEEEFTLCKKSIYFVIFQKQYFCKQQLKLGDYFTLLKPWHCMQVKSLQHPVIFCTHFKYTVNATLLNENCQISINKESRECVSIINKNLMGNLNTTRIESNKKEVMFYLKWKKSINIVGRIQRIWKIHSLHNCQFDFSRSKNNCWLSILLQSKQKAFYQFVIPYHFNEISTDCSGNVQYGEGRCYVFNNFRIAQRLQSLRYPKLFRYLQNLLKLNSESKLNQEIIYQLVIDDFSELSCEETFKSTDFPVYLQSCFKPLSYLQKDYTCFEHFSCVAKVLFQYKNYLYISDKSLFSSASAQYVRVVLTKEESYFMFSNVIIKEAVIHEGYLLLDQYSQISLLQENKCELNTLDLKSLNIPLNTKSKVADIVSVSGEIININENEACSWLQCNFCMSKNLIQDAEDIIYCEDCSLIVENPLLHLKMCVTIHNEEQPNLLLQIQLSSSTIKKILYLDGSSIHPHCNVSDILGKRIGPFICFIRGVEVITNKQIFHLNEINNSEIVIPPKIN